jgi:hypothetical protein
MAFKLADNVSETSITTGTGSFDLAGAVAGYKAFSNYMANGDTTLYAARMGTEWETGIGTYNSASDTLSRTTVLESSNGGSAVSFSAGTKTIVCADLANQTMTRRQATVHDDALVVVDPGDTTKGVRLDAGGVTAGQTRVLASPDYDGTIATQAGSETLTNKTLTSAVLNTGVSGSAVADQAAMETASSTSLIVTPGNQKYHPGHPKGWVVFNGTGTVAIIASFNVTSIIDNGTGNYDVNWNVDFSSAATCLVGMSSQNHTLTSSSGGIAGVSTILIQDNTHTLADAARINLVGLGDQ